MTEARSTPSRRATLLPTGRSLDLLVRWANEGPGELAPPPSDRGPRDRNDQRAWALDLLRRLARSLKVEAPELAPQRGQTRNFAALSDTLLTELARNAREMGYVTAGCRARVPLSPVQADTLHRLTWGCTSKEIARDVGRGKVDGVAGALKRARTEHGCHTNAQLIATAYRNGWFPLQWELRALRSGRMVWDLDRPGYDRPPYKEIV